MARKLHSSVCLAAGPSLHRKHFMNFKHKLLAVAAFATALSAQAAPVTIGFDDLAGGVVVGATYAGLGVVFTGALTAAFGSLPGGSAPMAIRHTSAGTTPGPATPIMATFSSAMSSVSLTGMDIGAAGFVMTAYDSAVGGSVLDTDSFFGVGVGIGTFHTLTLTGAGILRVEFSQASPCCGDGMAFDNLTFDTAGGTVPVPATPALVGLGLLAAGLVSRRKR